MKFVPYLPEHFLEIIPTVDGSRIPKCDFSVIAESHARYPATSVLEDDGKPIACFGITPLWNGVVVVWGVFESGIERYGMTLYRYSKSFLDSLMKDYSRVQCEVLATNSKAINFIETFGFEKEGLLRNYGPNKEDFFMYARVTK